MYSLDSFRKKKKKKTLESRENTATRAAILLLAFCVYYAMNKDRMRGVSVHSHYEFTLFLSFISKERNTMAA